MRIWKTAVLLIAVVCAGCVTPISVNPVGTTTGLRREMSLAGTWHEQQFRAVGTTLTVVPVGTEGMMTAFEVDPPRKPDEQGSFDLFQFSTAKLSENHFINARRLLLAGQEKREPDGWMPLFYTVKPNGRSAKLYYLDANKLAKVIDSGALKGIVKKSKDSDGRETIDAVAITADPAELDAFFAKPEAVGLFTLYRRYWKVE